MNSAPIRFGFACGVLYCYEVVFLSFRRCAVFCCWMVVFRFTDYRGFTVPYAFARLSSALVHRRSRGVCGRMFIVVRRVSAYKSGASMVW